MRHLRWFPVVISLLAATIAHAQNPSSFVQGSSAENGAISQTPRVTVKHFLPEALDEFARNTIMPIATNAWVDTERDLGMIRMEEDELQMIHAHYQQYYKGIPVRGGEVIVHLTATLLDADITNDLVPRVRVNTSPKLTPIMAIERAKQDYGAENIGEKAPVSKLWIMRKGEQDHLVFEVHLFSKQLDTKMLNPTYWIDAHTGKIYSKHSRVETAHGPTNYYGTVSFRSTYSRKAKSYFLYDTARRVGVFNAKNEDSPTKANYFQSDTDTWNDSSANEAYWGVVHTYDYYKNTHVRKGIDGYGGPRVLPNYEKNTHLITAYVHVGTSYSNAFWDSDALIMYFGDGDGIEFGPFTALDVCGHELTHGVTQFTSNLDYADEPGALNESFSDIMGAMVEASVLGESSRTWKIGEGVMLKQDALRYMDEPTKDGVSTDYYPERYKGDDDFGGVHTNSGIANKAFYLVAKGGTHRKGGSVKGIGTAKAAKIFYKAFTQYMTSGSSFSKCHAATLKAAKVLYGATSTQYKTVDKAWKLCGVK